MSSKDTSSIKQREAEVLTLFRTGNLAQAVSKALPLLDTGDGQRGRDDAFVWEVMTAVRNSYDGPAPYSATRELAIRLLELVGRWKAQKVDDDPMHLLLIGELQRHNGMSAEPEQCFRKALDIAHKRYGPTAGLTLEAAGLVAIFSADNDEAVALYTRVIEGNRAQHGPRCPQNFWPLIGIAGRLWDDRDDKRVLETYEQAVEIWEKHTDTVEPHHICSIVHDLTDVVHEGSCAIQAAATAVLRRALKVAEELLADADDDIVAETFETMGDSAPDDADATRFYERVLALRNDPDTWSRGCDACLRSTVGYRYMAWGEPEKALPLLQQAVGMNESLPAEQTDCSARWCVQNLRECLVALGRTDEAAKLGDGPEPPAAGDIS